LIIQSFTGFAWAYVKRKSDHFAFWTGLAYSQAQRFSILRGMNPTFNKLRQDIYGITVLALGAFFLLALATYAPTDFSWNSLPSHKAVQNACGVVGSFVADILFQALGWAAWAMS
jgi:hypothetical protein